MHRGAPDKHLSVLDKTELTFCRDLALLHPSRPMGQRAFESALHTREKFWEKGQTIFIGLVRKRRSEETSSDCCLVSRTRLPSAAGALR